MRIKLCSAHFFTNQISTLATVLGIRRFVVEVVVADCNEPSRIFRGEAPTRAYSSLTAPTGTFTIN